ncbi:hypothetical protein LUZ60_016061 [Juncus effusus]|nr:hypothetical protein LUZ60_016061 [Juncus effusus]
MKDFPSCFGENSIALSEANTITGINSNSFALDRSLQSVTTSIFKAILSNRKELILKLIWSRSASGYSLSVAIDDGSSSSSSSSSSSITPSRPPKSSSHGTPSMSGNIPLPANVPILLQKKKGSRSFVTENTVVGLHWDLSYAKYGLAPEPVKDFYVVVITDAEFSLLFGDMCRDFIRKFEDAIPVARFSFLCRKEQLRGTTLFTTKSRFRDEGRDHDLVIQCKGDEWDSKDAELTVSIDKKKVVQVKRLKWNFRGNQTIFVEGAVVDMMWDIHDWWFCNPAGSALFMFKTRTSSDSRLWLDEEQSRSSQVGAGGGGGGSGGGGFFLLIEGYKKQ